MGKESKETQFRSAAALNNALSTFLKLPLHFIQAIKKSQT
jgi:hypothetical protein